MASRVTSEFFGIMRDTWWRAERAGGGSIERCYRIAGLIVRLHFSGWAMLSAIQPALKHLELPRTKLPPSLTVRLWDCASNGISIPPAPCAMEDFAIRGDMRGFNGGRYYAAYQRFDQILSIFDAKSQEAIVCASDVSQIPTSERAAPLRGLLGWLMRQHGIQMVHAAGVGNSNCGLLLVGRGGAGKSNTAVGCLMAGLCYTGDDFCAVSSDPMPTVHSVYCSAKITKGDWAEPPLPISNRGDPETEKRLYYLHPHYGRLLPASLRILGLLLPNKTENGDPSVHSISCGQAVLDMARQTSSMLPNAGGEVLSTLSRLARQVPCYRLDLGCNPHRIPQVVSQLIRKLEAAGAS